MAAYRITGRGCLRRVRRADVSLAHVPRKAILEGLAYIFIGALPLVGLVLGATYTHGGMRMTLLVGLSAAVAAGIVLAHVYYPTFDLWGACFHRAPVGHRQIAITFDDGPSEHTEAILDALAAAKARATFFWVGEHVRARPDLVRRALAAGHVIGNHTDTHRKLPLASARELEAQISRAQEALRQAGAGEIALFRAPHGFKSLFLGRVLRRHGLRLVGWTRGIWDTDNPGVDVIAHRGLVDMCDGEVLLLHDGGGDRSQTTAALPLILNGARGRGLELVTIPELAATGSVDRSLAVAAAVALAAAALVMALAI
jgi:peptidoglycan/xylan/chitin deacetylase (PgdA/CDA1 family)